MIFLVDNPNQIIHPPRSTRTLRKAFCVCCSSEARSLRPISLHTSHLECCNVLSGGERGDRKCYKGREELSILNVLSVCWLAG